MILALRFICLLLLTLSASAQDFDEIPMGIAKNNYQFNGNVQSVIQHTYAPAKDALIYMGDKKWERDAGWTKMETKELVIDSSGHVLQLKAAVLVDSKKAGISNSKTQMHYAKEKLVAIVQWQEEKRIDSIRLHYKRVGPLDNYTVYNHKHKIQYKVTYAYDRNGRVITVRKKDESNYPVAMVKYKYSQNKLIEKQYFNRDFIHTDSRRYSDSKVSDSLYNSSFVLMDNTGKIKTGMTFVKDKDGAILEQSTLNSERQVTDYRKYQYDSRKEMAEASIFSTTLQQNIVNKISYDEQGNWTRKEVYHDDILFNLVERSLIYR